MQAVPRLARALLLPVTLGLAAGCTSNGATERRAGAGGTPLDVLEEQVEAWNRGDIEGFVASGYREGPETTFFSGDRVARGSEELLARYLATYATEGAEMGQLAFSDLEMLPLSRDAALVRGRWSLALRTRPDAGGLFTLLFRRYPEGWRIVHDHTSTGAPQPRR